MVLHNYLFKLLAWLGRMTMALQVTPLKESLLLSFFNLALPTVDVYSDIVLAVKLCSHVSFVHHKRNSIYRVDSYYTYNAKDHPKWATSLLIPFLFNYLLSWRAWYLKEKESKKYTWIFALLGCYPQLVAGRIIWLLWKRPKEGIREKKHLERNVIENEIFTEAVPSTLIMTFLFVSVLHARYDGEVSDVIFGDNPHLFYATFATSALSAGLGLAKCLKVRIASAKVGVQKKG